MAGIHGGYEWNTIALANELITHINEHPEAIPTDAKLYIIRNMNPDGEARDHGVDGRVNNNGVDLNRNFPTENWVRRLGPRWLLDLSPHNRRRVWGLRTRDTHGDEFHCQSQDHSADQLSQCGIGSFPGRRAVGRRIQNAWPRHARIVTKYPYPPIDTGCEYTGTLADWAVENGVGAAVDMELTNHKNTDFDKNLKALKVLLSFIP